MPTIDYSQLSALPLTELIFAEPAALTARGNNDLLFNDYLQRANEVSKPFNSDDPITNDRDAYHALPLKADQAPKSAEHRDAVQNKTESRDQEPSVRARDDKPAASELSGSNPSETREEQSNTKENKQDEEKVDDGVEKANDKNVVKDKKKGKEEKTDAKPAADPLVATPKVPVELPVKSDEQPIAGTVQKEADKESSDGTKASPNIAETSLKLADPASAKVNKSKLKAETADITAVFDPQSPREQIDQAGNQAVAEISTDVLKDAAGDGKAKSKKNREAAAETKDAQRKHKFAGESPAEASAQQSLNTSSTATNKEAGDSVATTSVAAQASASVLQSVLEVLKNAEKPASSQDSVGPISDVRANSATQTIKPAAVREGGTPTTAANSDNSAYALRAQFVQRVERAFAAMGNREGNVRLKLSPPELGVLKLEIGVHKGVMKARIEAETPAAKSLLLDNLPELRERLTQQNIHIQQFDVDLMDRSAGGMQQQTFGQGDFQSQQDTRSSQHANAIENAPVGADSTASPQRAGMGGSLNVFV
jgi:flagellar hook-length control protein FliK